MSPSSVFPYENRGATLSGVRNRLYTKPIVFSPRRVDLVEYGPGAHSAKYIPAPKIIGNSKSGKVFRVNPFPTSMLVYERSADYNLPKLLHYRFHGMGNFTERWKSLNSRRSAENIQCGFGVHYEISQDLQIMYYNWVQMHSEIIYFESDCNF